ncbi:MAG: ubiquinone biosynthesis protein UbiA [Proteobacteria bacterium]|nr:ubiquinone biosynthesis protein UbiA [Pseudomonadota bacterium]NIS72585.1 ubiquinone biosynthesis protein UbiA [Pseudomonadota bacterium]
MNSISVSSAAALSRLKLFLALSRTPHGLLDLATPALGAILWLGGFPTLQVTVLGLGTAFAGYTAVYALNDLVDSRVDREIIQDRGWADSGGDLDAVFVRHPIAQGLMTFQEGLWWSAFWALLALMGAYWLNPVCALIFIIGFVLEAIYCLLLDVSHLRTLVSGVVKTSGGIAAAFAVDPDPSPAFLITLFFWLFFWEIGGQNVPNDWHDLEEDDCLEVKTVPARYGLRGAGLIILCSLAISITLGVVLFSIAPLELSFPFLEASLFVGFYFLLLPAFRLYRTRNQTRALVLFNKASYYPLALLVIVLFRLIT